MAYALQTLSGNMSQTEPQKKMITPKEAAANLGVSSSTLSRWRHDNTFMPGVHYVMYGPRIFRYSAEWIEKFRLSGGRGAHKLEVIEFLESQRSG